MNDVAELQYLSPSGKGDQVTAESTLCLDQPKVTPKWGGNFNSTDLDHLQATASESTCDSRDGADADGSWEIVSPRICTFDL